jgi:hypothetical protein
VIDKLRVEGVELPGVDDTGSAVDKEKNEMAGEGQRERLME